MSHGQNRAPRFPRSIPVLVHTEGRQFEAHVINLSSTGALLRCSQRLRSGLLLDLSFLSRSTRSPVIRAQVVRTMNSASSVHSRFAIEFVIERSHDQQVIDYALSQVTVSSWASFDRKGSIVSFIIKLLFVLLVAAIAVLFYRANN